MPFNVNVAILYSAAKERKKQDVITNVTWVMTFIRYSINTLICSPEFLSLPSSYTEEDMHNRNENFPRSAVHSRTSLVIVLIIILI